MEALKKIGSNAVCECGETMVYSCATTNITRHLATQKHKKAMENKDDEQLAPKKAKTVLIANIFTPDYGRRALGSKISSIRQPYL